MADAPVPPQNLDAEASVLGAMLLSPVAIERASEAVQPADFYRESHGLVFKTALGMYTAGASVDAITLTDELERQGALVAAGGRDYIFGLAASVSAVGNAAHYARIVREMAVFRALIRIGNLAAQRGYERAGDPAELVEKVEGAIFGLAQGRTVEDLEPVSAPLQVAFKRLEQLGEHGRAIVGLSTGFARIDDVTSGLQPGNLVLVAARPSMGKAQNLAAPVLTPRGWRRIGDLHAGDLIIGRDGRPCSVVAVHERGEIKTYHVTFDDGAIVECCADHLWLTTTRNERRRGVSGTVRSTAEIAVTLRRPDGYGWNHTVPWVDPVEFARPDNALTIDPYLLGVYLAEGDSARMVRITNPEPDIMQRVRDALPATDELRGGPLTWRIARRTFNGKQSATATALTELGLTARRSHEKFIPEIYLRASAAERLELLRGLIDGDGYIDPTQGRSVEISTSSRALADGIVFLVGSLGGRISRRERRVAAVVAGERVWSAHLSHRLIVSFPASDLVPFASTKHRDRWRPGRARRAHRYIVSVAPARLTACRCITVEGDYYVTEGFAVTHNSAMCLGVAAQAAIHDGLPVALFTLEMSRLEVTQRLLTMLAMVDSQRIRNGRLDSSEWGRLHRAGAQIDKAPLYMDDSGALTMVDIRAKARRFKMRHPDLALVIVDYVQLMTGGVGGDNRNQELSVISRALKVLARELDVPVLALSQLSRAVEQRHDKRPILSDLRDSGSLEQDADVVMFLYRDEYYNPEAAAEEGTEGIAEVNVAKHRNGPTETVKLSWVKRFARFSNLALPGDVGGMNGRYPNASG